jgi:hypothetical protein
MHAIVRSKSFFHRRRRFKGVFVTDALQLRSIAIVARRWQCATKVTACALISSQAWCLHPITSDEQGHCQQREKLPSRGGFAVSLG